MLSAPARLAAVAVAAAALVVGGMPPAGASGPGSAPAHVAQPTSAMVSGVELENTSSALSALTGKIGAGPLVQSSETETGDVNIHALSFNYTHRRASASAATSQGFSIVRFSLLVDGTEVAFDDRPTPPDPRYSWKFMWESAVMFLPASVAHGWHDIAMSATDNVGNTVVAETERHYVGLRLESVRLVPTAAIPGHGGRMRLELRWLMHGYPLDYVLAPSLDDLPLRLFARPQGESEFQPVAITEWIYDRCYCIVKTPAALANSPTEWFLIVEESLNRPGGRSEVVLQSMAPAPPTVSLIPDVISAGQSTLVTYRGTPGTTVDILSRTQPATAFSKIGTVTLDREGVATSSHRPQRNTRISVRTAAGQVSASAPLLLVRSVSSLSVNRVAGRTYAFTGRVYPAVNNRLVNVYRNGALVGQARTEATGTFKVTRTLGVGTFSFQARTANDQYNLGAKSPTRQVTVV